MPSVIVNWSGRCTDRSVQEGLCRQLGELAELSHGYFEEPKPVVRYFDEAIEGGVLLDGSLVGGDGTIALREPVLHGIEFRLYDGRGLYPGDDRISFVFLTSADDPGVNGQVVLVEDREQCARYESPTIQDADWFLATPRIHLRYYCEAWMDLLLGWVKAFYVPSLDYIRYERLSGYADFQRMVERAGAGPQARDVLLRWLQHRFRQEVAEWAGTASEARALWGRLDESREKDT